MGIHLQLRYPSPCSPPTSKSSSLYFSLLSPSSPTATSGTKSGIAFNSQLVTLHEPYATKSTSAPKDANLKLSPRIVSLQALASTVPSVPNKNAQQITVAAQLSTISVIMTRADLTVKAH